MNANQFEVLDGSRLRVAIITARFNQELTDALLADCLGALREAQVPTQHITSVRVPGSFELPVVAAECADRGIFHAIICLGVIIRGDTRHDYYIANAVSQGLIDVSVRTRIPILFGVLTTENRAQAEARALGHQKKGWEAGMSAVEAALALRDLR